MTRSRRMPVWLVLLCGWAIFGGACALFEEIPPTPTRLPFEPARTYIGRIPDVEGWMALIVTETRALAAACTLNDAYWRTFDRWLTGGTVESGTTGASVRIEARADGAQVTAVIAGDTARGAYTASDGRTFPFEAAFITDAARIAAGEETGIYRVNDPVDAPSGSRLLLLVQNVEQGHICGLITGPDGAALSRVAVEPPWQAGFSTLRYLDLQKVVYGVGVLGHIDSILLP